MKFLQFTPNTKFIPTRKRKATLHIQTTIAPRLGWSDGCCSYFAVHTKPGLPPQQLIFGDNFSKPTTTQVIQSGNFIVETGIFRGKESCPRVYCTPEDREWVESCVVKPGTTIEEINL